jgi:hypothetical protein
VDPDFSEEVAIFGLITAVNHPKFLSPAGLAVIDFPTKIRYP